MGRNRPYNIPNIVLEEPSNTEELDQIDAIETIDDVATLQPGKNAQLAAKKLSKKYKKNERDKYKKE